MVFIFFFIFFQQCFVCFLICFSFFFPSYYYFFFSIDILVHIETEPVFKPWVSPVQCFLNAFHLLVIFSWTVVIIALGHHHRLIIIIIITIIIIVFLVGNDNSIIVFWLELRLNDYCGTARFFFFFFVNCLTRARSSRLSSNLSTNSFV